MINLAHSKFMMEWKAGKKKHLIWRILKEMNCGDKHL